MAPKTATKLIKVTLANLTTENYEKFCYELLDREGEPRVDRNQVENKNCVVVTDVLVTTFNAGAPAVVVELLKEIGCHKHAEQLEREIGEQSSNPGPSDRADFVVKHLAELNDRMNEMESNMHQFVIKGDMTRDICDQILALLKREKEIGGQSSNPGSSATVRPSAGAGAGCTEEHFVDKHRAELINRVNGISSILDELLNNEAITLEAYNEILAIPTKRDMMRKLYSGALHAAGPEGKKVFYKILEKQEPYLFADLKEKK